MFTPEAIKLLSQSEAITAANIAVQPAKDVTHKFNGESSFETSTAALPNDFSIHDLERYNPTRRRARGTMATSNVPDFAAYVDNHKEAGACVFIQQDKMTAIAVLNLGTPDAPGHTDNRAELAPKKTAAYTELKTIATGQAKKQQEIAEFFEDWAGNIKFFNEAGAITPPQAIAAIRKITIETLKKLENSEAQLSASKSAFESVTAKSAEPIPTTIYFTTVPYHGLKQREFVMRLGILAGGDKPAVNLRIVNQEQHNEDMAIELVEIVSRAFIRVDINNESTKEVGLPVLIGEYSAKSQ